MKSSWLRYQKDAAQQWNPRQAMSRAHYAPDLVDAARYAQAYRLYTLALAGQPEIGAMNRLRENSLALAGERWMLASTYKLAGKPDVAQSAGRERPAARPSCSPMPIPTPSARCCAIARWCSWA